MSKRTILFVSLCIIVGAVILIPSYNETVINALSPETSQPVMYSSSPITSVRVLKTEHKLQLLSGEMLVKEFPVVFGKNFQGHKMQEGDKRTPEGNYVLDYKKADSAFYRAIHISYPNKTDLAVALGNGVKPGGQIMIHGQKNGWGWLSFITQKRNWTNGCVALDNKDMDIVWSLVDAGTPIEIQP